MRTLKTLKPGQKGTKELLTRYGPSLLCVRYRYDEDTREGLKAVEIIVQRHSREREAGCLGSRKTAGRAESGASRRVALRIGWRERDLRLRVWMLRRDVAERLELLHRVVGGGS